MKLDSCIAIGAIALVVLLVIFAIVFEVAKFVAVWHFAFG